jgi:hypothetical protein
LLFGDAAELAVGQQLLQRTERGPGFPVRLCRRKAALSPASLGVIAARNQCLQFGLGIVAAAEGYTFLKSLD